MILASRVNTVESLHYDLRDSASGSRRVRRSVASTSPQQAQYIGSSNKKLRLQGDLPLYLKASPDSSSLSVGPHNADDPQVCFRMHTFNLLEPVTSPVVLEAQDGRHLTQDSNNRDKLELTAGAAPQQTSLTDGRFFVEVFSPGDRYVKLKHLHSGLYVSASGASVSLLDPASSGSPSSFLFEEFDCTHT